MVITVLEANVDPDKAGLLQDAYKDAVGQLPHQMIRTYLLRGSDPSLWQIVSVWKSREALEEMRRGGGTPAGVLMFRKAGAEPRLTIFDVAASAP
jgi:hypothetical protein